MSRKPTDRAATSLFPEIAKEAEALRDSLDPLRRVNREIERYRELHKLGAISTAELTSAIDQAREGLHTQRGAVEDLGKSMVSSLGNSIQSLIAGHGDWRQVAVAALTDIIRLTLEAVAATRKFGDAGGSGGLLGSIFGGLFGGATGSGSLAAASAGAFSPGVGPGGLGFLTFGGPRAMGGPVRPGEFYPVGERGPELLATGIPGTIIPNHALGGTVNVTQHINVHPDIPAVTRRIIREETPRIAEHTKAVVQQARIHDADFFA